MAVTASPRRPPPGKLFVGREWELDQLHRGLTAAQEGRGQLLLVGGEAGIGKTRLVGELAELAESAGVRVLWGRCWEGEEAPAFWPWTQIFRNLVPTSGASVAVAAQAPPDFARLIPELEGSQVGEADASRPIPLSQARFRLFDTSTMFLRTVAVNQPIVLILEDLHEADRSSLMLLEFLAGQLRDMRLLVLATYREPEADLNAEVRSTLSKVIRSGHRIPLTGLGHQEVAEFLDQGFELLLPDDVLSAVREKTGGNPFFLDELARSFAADQSGRLSGALPVPEGLKTPIRSRLSALRSEEKAVLTVASVIGREFSLELLATAAGLRRDKVLGALGTLTDRRFVDLAGFGLGPYRFAHGLIRETIYEDLSVEERWGLHHRVGEAIETLHASHLDGYLDQLAHHFLQAAALGDVDRAIRYSQRAGQRATLQLGYEESVGHYRRALHLAEATEQPAPQRFDLLLALGNAQWWAGHVTEAGQSFQSAAFIAREMKDPTRLAEAALRVGEVGHGGVYMQAWTYDALRVELLDEALRTLDAPSALRVRVLARLSTALYFSPFDSAARRETLSRDAVELGRRIGEESTLAYALNARHLAVWAPDNIAERLALASEIIDLGSGIGDLSLELTGRVWHLADLLEIGSAQAADREIEAYSALADSAGYPHFVAYAFMFRAVRSMLKGQFSDAERFARRSADLGERVADINLQLSHHVQMAILRALQGRPEETAAHLELASGGVTDQVDKLHVSMMCLAGDRAGASEALSSIWPVRDGVPPAFWLPMHAGAAVLASSAGAAGEAKAIYEALRPYERRWVLSGRDAVAALGPVAYYLGLLAATLGQFDLAAGHFDVALETAQAIGERPYLALTQTAYGGMLAKRGIQTDQPRALQLLTYAAEAAEELGMNQVHDQVEAARALLGAGSDSDSPGLPEAPAPIFRKDGEYWIIGFRGVTVLMKDARGLHLLRRLLAAPGTELHVLNLAAGSTTSSNKKPGERLPDGWSVEGISAEPLLDPAAKAAYRTRIEELNREIEEAEDHHDLGRASSGREEMQYILDELARAVGLGGRDRRATSPAERARSSVSKSIRSSVRRIQTIHPALGSHLASTIRTGYLCSYQPGEPVNWKT